ncbi:hypothetical protein [Allosalinactinospora lopnorensis]|uniref:hypothetical protein n=1 Tax=Allosalinactinospora lopnorensis TaxID=1352348 RepID=UPI000623BAE9|nr:hypothetical protein [Allosalinactinospora lopnorensis]
MMALLRSRRMLVILVGVVTAALIATGAVGLFNAMRAPAPAPPSPPQGQGAEESAPAPEMDALGSAPDEVDYTDLGEECEGGECYRLVGITAEGLDGDEAIEAVYGHLLDQEWGQVVPEGSQEPEDVPETDTILTDGEVMVQGSSAPYAQDTTAGLILAHAQAPNQ